MFPRKKVFYAFVAAIMLVCSVLESVHSEQKVPGSVTKTRGKF